MKGEVGGDGERVSEEGREEERQASCFLSKMEEWGERSWLRASDCLKRDYDGINGAKER